MSVTNGLSQYLENAILNWHRGTTFPACPATVYLALFTTPPVNGVDSSAVEATGTSYARVAVTVNTTNFAAPSGAAPATILSGATFTWPTVGSGGWGTVTGWGLYDASSAGNLLDYGTFPAQTLAAADTIAFASGQLSISVQ